MSVADSATLRGADLALPIFAGLAQAAGLVLTIVGAAVPTRREVEVEVEVEVAPDRAGARLRAAF